VQELYNFDIESFEGLDSGTLSKWERNVTRPKISRQVSILKYFQQKSGVALPCWDKYGMEETEKIICQTGMHNLLGKSKQLVLNFPSSMIAMEELKVYQLRNTESIEKIIAINIDLDRDFNREYSSLGNAHFLEWALHPSNSFFVCEYQEQFFGLLFTLRLKPEVFRKVIHFEKREDELTIDDFASFDEKGSNYIVSFFALSDKAAAILFIRYYAHLIANQHNTEEVGLGTMMEDARKLIGNMNLKPVAAKQMADGRVLQMYSERLPEFLASEKVLKMIFSTQSCPEE
jgi:hypothetical protein